MGLIDDTRSLPQRSGVESLVVRFPSKLSKPSVSATPTPAVGVLVLAVVAVLVAVGALVRFYSRTHTSVRVIPDAEVEIVAPELEPLPTGTSP